MDGVSSPVKIMHGVSSPFKIMNGVSTPLKIMHGVSTPGIEGIGVREPANTFCGGFGYRFSSHQPTGDESACATDVGSASCATDVGSASCVTDVVGSACATATDVVGSACATATDVVGSACATATATDVVGSACVTSTDVGLTPWQISLYTRTNRIPCQICFDWFSSPSALEEHCRKVHNRVVQLNIQCSECRAYFTSYGLRALHKVREDERRCPIHVGESWDQWIARCEEEREAANKVIEEMNMKKKND